MEDDDRLEKEYRWYVLGCQHEERIPVSEEEFRTRYKRYLRCQRVIQAFDRKRKPGVARDKKLEEDNLLSGMVSNIVQAKNALFPIAMLVELGQRIETGGEDGVGGAGVTADLWPRTPVLVGCGAKLLPSLDPEPQWRDP